MCYNIIGGSHNSVLLHILEIQSWFKLSKLEIDMTVFWSLCICKILDSRVKSISLDFMDQPVYEIKNSEYIFYCHWLKYIAVSGTSVTGYLLSFGNLIVNPVHFPFTENKRDK